MTLLDSARLEQTASESNLPGVMSALRIAQARWSSSTLTSRLACIRRFRFSLCEHAERLAATASLGRTATEVLTSEIIPLCDAARYLELEAPRILSPKKLSGRARPFWLIDVELDELREPFGIILLVGAGNYPLFLLGVQLLQALCAGNAVVVKPARGTAEIAHQLFELLESAGMRDLITVLSEEDSEVHRAIAAGANKVVLTGGPDAGREVLHSAAEHSIPGIMELSGCDAFIVLPSADLALAAAAVRFGLSLNTGQTCIRPARLIVHSSVISQFNEHLRTELGNCSRQISPTERRNLIPLIDDALSAGATTLVSRDSVPAVLQLGTKIDVDLWHSERMLPAACEVAYNTDEECLRLVHTSRFALGASIFGSPRQATALAARLKVGTVVINDIIVPTADPRLSFGGRGASGFGTTRGSLGLLEMTQLKSIATRATRFRPHLRTPQPADEPMLFGALRAMHGGTVRVRIRGLWDAIRAASKRSDS